MVCPSTHTHSNHHILLEIIEATMLTGLGVASRSRLGRLEHRCLGCTPFLLDQNL